MAASISRWTHLETTAVGLKTGMKTGRASISRVIASLSRPKPRFCSSYQTSAPCVRRARTNARHQSLSWWLWLTKIRTGWSTTRLHPHAPRHPIEGVLIVKRAESSVNTTGSATCDELAHPPGSRHRTVQHRTRVRLDYTPR